MNSKGFTLVEILVATVIVMVGLWGTMSVVGFANRTEVLKSRTSQKESLVYNLMQDLRKKPETLQVNFSGTPALTLLANPANFPLAWDLDKNVSTISECVGCRGRLGYVVQPMPGYSDFYLASIRICPDYSVTTSCEFYQMYMVTK